MFLSIHPSMVTSCFYIMAIMNIVARSLGVQTSSELTSLPGLLSSPSAFVNGASLVLRLY